MNKLAIAQKFMSTNVGSKLMFKTQKIGFKMQKNSPEILLGTGIIAMSAALIGVGVATVKARDILEDHQQHLININEAAADADNTDYDSDDLAHDTRLAYARLVKKMALVYGPPVLLAGASVFCFCKGQSVLKTRNAALAASLAGVTDQFRRYRDKVVEKYGKEVDEEMRYAVVNETVKDEDGKKHTVRTIPSEVPGYGPYARVFDDNNANWQGSTAFVKQWLEGCEAHCNAILSGRGVLYLNEVYDMLGFDRTPAGQIHGWVYDPRRDVDTNWVDFGMKDFSKANSKAWQLGETDAIILDFNVDGYILDKVPDSY